MNDLQIQQINDLRHNGQGYRTIAAKLDLPINSVKSWCRRHPLESSTADNCLYCGAKITSIPHKRQRKFCSDKCRFAWWSEHSEERTVKTAYRHLCRHCGTEFFNNRVEADYCSRECFAKARMKVNFNG